MLISAVSRLPQSLMLLVSWSLTFYLSVSVFLSLSALGSAQHAWRPNHSRYTPPCPELWPHQPGPLGSVTSFQHQGGGPLFPTGRMEKSVGHRAP